VSSISLKPRWSQGGEQTGWINIRPPGRYSVALECACGEISSSQVVNLRYTSCNIGGKGVVRLPGLSSRLRSAVQAGQAVRLPQVPALGVFKSVGGCLRSLAAGAAEGGAETRPGDELAEGDA
jgi:hypothetical protein